MGEISSIHFYSWKVFKMGDANRYFRKGNCCYVLVWCNVKVSGNWVLHCIFVVSSLYLIRGNYNRYVYKKKNVCFISFENLVPKKILILYIDGIMSYFWFEIIFCVLEIEIHFDLYLKLVIIQLMNKVNCFTVGAFKTLKFLFKCVFMMFEFLLMGWKVFR
jgi:hypothetical protein